MYVAVIVQKGFLGRLSPEGYSRLLKAVKTAFPNDPAIAALKE